MRAHKGLIILSGIAIFLLSIVSGVSGNNLNQKYFNQGYDFNCNGVIVSDYINSLDHDGSIYGLNVIGLNLNIKDCYRIK